MSSFREGQVNQLANALEAAGFTPEDVTRLGQGDLVSIRSVIRGQAKIVPVEPQEPKPVLKLISGDHNLILDACDGTKIIANAKKVFPAGIDSDFERWGADEPGQSAPETIPIVYEMAKDVTFSQMFGSLSADVKNLCFTQHQIISFVEKYPEWLRADGYATFFLFESGGHLFVASVDVNSVGLRVDVYRFEYSLVWRAGRRHRVVVPQLAA